MFTNGMTESVLSKICLKDICFEAFMLMLDFMYSGEINKDGVTDIDMLLLQLLLMADQFGVSLLHQECCKRLLEHLSEGSACQILLVVSSIPSCKIIEEKCERKFAMHSDYCTTANIDFVMLDETTFGNILQHQDLTVTLEERVLNAILLWCCEAEDLFGWERLDETMMNSTPEAIFGDRLKLLEEFSNFVSWREATLACIFRHLVNCKYQHKKSSFKELYSTYATEIATGSCTLKARPMGNISG